MRRLRYDRIILTIVIITLISYKVTTLLQFKTVDDVIEDTQNINIEPTQTEITPVDTESITMDINSHLNDSFTSVELENISLAIYIPEYDYSYTFNDTLELLSASTIKIPLNMYIYDLALTDPTILSQELTYDEMFYEDGSGIMQSTEPGTTFDVQTLLTYSIMYSDNIATNMLFDEFIKDVNNRSELIPYWGETETDAWISTTSNKMRALQLLYRNRETYSTLIDDMTNSVYKHRSPLYLPRNVKSAVKTGDVELTIHDMMIVFDNKYNDYLITISMDDIIDSEERMASLSRYIYYRITN